jgi:hypothetical protein
MTFTLWHVLLALSVSIPLARRDARMARVWLVFVTATGLVAVYQSPPFFIAVDLIAAAFVLAKPRCAWQKAIGLIILSMATMTIGFMIAEFAYVHKILSAAPDQARLWHVYSALSWAELALFFVWGGYDWLYGLARNYSGDGGLILASKNRRD